MRAAQRGALAGELAAEFARQAPTRDGNELGLIHAAIAPKTLGAQRSVGRGKVESMIVCDFAELDR